MPPEGLFARARFKHPWRPYQRRVLDSLERYLGDRRLHVIAPPGSGKTILGLEVLRRIGRPALVLTPTVTVREQWLRRLGDDFLEAPPSVSEVSRDLGAPATLTVATYQALAREFQRGRGSELVAALAAAALATLVVDEAHHLRSYWWRCLSWLESELGGPRVVALTATPPYDVPRAEWNRYAGFCGPVDEEIGTPELVREGNLCPHQDYVYLSVPAESDMARMREFDADVASLVADLAIDDELARLVAADPRVASPAEHRDELLAERELYLALALFLRGLRYEAARPLLRELDLLDVELPALDRAWAELLLDGLLSDERWSAGDAAGLLEALRRRLARLGAIERRRVLLRRHRRDVRALTQSPTKLASICRIFEAEWAETADRRLVVLADYIRESALPRVGDEAARPFVKLGVVPIFESLRRLCLPGLRLCALTGSLVLLPRGVGEHLPGRAGALAARLRLRPLPHAPDFVRVGLRERDRRRCVQLVTDLFGAGVINGIVGTASLLGEGWDAPEIDTLILASTVGAYVSSNQMRGRAIRSSPADRGKVANIWHLACVDPAAAVEAAGGGDLDGLRRRFDSFVGLALEGTVIESGLERLRPELAGPVGASQVEPLNATMVRAASERRRLRRRWLEAVGTETTGHELVRELRVPPGRLVPRLALRARGRPAWQGPALRWLARRRLLEVGRAVARALAAAELIAPGWRLEVESRGRLCRATLRGVRHREQERFVDHLAQVLDLVSSPRYLMARGHRHYAVPPWFGENRRRAALFARAWNRPLARRLAPFRLVFTRSAAGRRQLLRAARGHLLAYHEARVEVRTSWRA